MDPSKRLTILCLTTLLIITVNNRTQEGAPQASRPLEGFVDMHAHPMTHLAFGGKLIHGAPDVGSLIPTDSNCRSRVRATSMDHALGLDRATHGGWDAFNNGCGDTIRKQVIDAMAKELNAEVGPEGALPGGPLFPFWPKWNDVLHQKMWIDWIRRAHAGGLRVMVSLATHNQTIAAAVMGPGDSPGDDRASADLQISEMKAMVDRHRDFMEVAYTPADLRRIVGAGKLAVVLGLEMDTIGNFNKVPAVSNPMITGELQRLHGQGVRYIFPIHVIDNKFGGTAVYTDMFNLSNLREYGSFWDLECSPIPANVNYKFVVQGFDAAVAVVKVTKLGIDPTRIPPPPPPCPVGSGHVNRKGLTPLGEFAVKEMMKLGMLIDIDHMSEKSANRALQIAESVPGGYPINSGHNGYRANGGNENSRTDEQIKKIAALGGIFGVGTEAITAPTFVSRFAAIALKMGDRGVAMGTDLNGMVRGARPRAGAIQYDSTFPKSQSGPRAWDYNTEGVAQYGLLSDFVRDIHGMEAAGQGKGPVERTLFSSAEHFAQMWERAERTKGSVN